MPSEPLTFIVFEQNLCGAAGDVRWPKSLEIDRSADEGGSFGTIYHLAERDGAPAGCCLKVFKNLGCRLPEGAAPSHQAAWKPAHDEYDKLCRLNGLGGHAPVAFAYGAVVQPPRAGRFTARPAFAMEDLAAKGEFVELSALGARPRATAEAAVFGLDLLEAIELLKENEIAHADLSEGNIMVELGPDGRTIRRTALVDFGQSKQTDEGVTPASRGFRLGTMPFAAPEILPLMPGDRPTPFSKDEHERFFKLRNAYTVDLWSLGALLYRLRTGDRPQLSIHWSGQRGCYVDADDRTLDFATAFDTIIAEKRAGLRLPFSATPQDRALGDAIRICTSADPGARDIIRIEACLRAAAVEEGEGRAEMTPDMVVVLEPSPAAAARAAAAQAVEAAAGAVEAAAGAEEEIAEALEVAAAAAASEVAAVPRSEPAPKPAVAVAAAPRSEAAPKPAVASRPASANSHQFRHESYGVFYRIGPSADGRPFHYPGWLMPGAPADVLLLGSDPLVTEQVRTLHYGLSGPTYELIPVDEPGAPAVDMSRRAEVSDHDKRRFASIAVVRVIDLLAPRTMAHWFDGCANLREVNGTPRLHTGLAEDMSCLFQGCRSLEDLEGFEPSPLSTKSARTLERMFAFCSSLRELDASRFNTARVASVNGMFLGCDVLESVDLRRFSTESLEDARGMFDGCTKLERVRCSPELAERLRRDQLVAAGVAICED